MTYDANFKQLLPDFLKGCEIRANEPVGKLPLEIDMIVTCQGTNKAGIAIPIFKEHFSSINIIEHKSSHFPPARNDIAKIAGYVGLYCAQHSIPIEAIAGSVTAWYITAARPGFFNDFLSKKVIEKAGTPGLYRLVAAFPCPCLAIVIDELDREEGNYPMLGFGTDRVMVDTIVTMDELRRRHELSPILENYLNMICVLNYEVLHAMTETKGIVADAFKKNIKLIVHDMGVEEFIKALGAQGMKEVIDAVGVKEVIDAVGVKEVIDAVGVEAVIDAIGVDNIERLLIRRKTPVKSKMK